MKKTADCEFHEEYDNKSHWNTYYSVRHPQNTEKSVKWYIALNRHGRPRTAMSSKHRSSRFKTKATTVTVAPDFDIDRTRKSRKPTRKPTRRPYRRLTTRGKSRRPKKERKSKSQGQHNRVESNLSNILSSIEEALKVNKTIDSDPESFRDSMFIDLGKYNIFSNKETGDRIRHPTSKIASERQRQRKTYRRKSNGKRS